MKGFIIKSFGVYLLLLLLLGIGCQWVMVNFFPMHTLRQYYLLPIFFGLFYFAFIAGVSQLVGRKTKTNWQSYYLIMKGIKVMLSFVLMICFLFLIRSGAVAFLILFLVYYFVMLLFESLFVYSFENRLKKENGCVDDGVKK